ncbi:MAG: inorganic phosphate transporter [Pirellulaceae bacterium]|nr:inorganic phosphate transporter [Pirellulaceae bacterium]
MFGLGIGLSALLVLCILCVCAFEFINGFHDTANAVATVIYTKSLKPWRAVVLSGILNGLGVFMGGTAVAMGIINLLPVETLVDQNVMHSLGMVGAILLTAIIWNLGTWLLAIPASSSHTLIGAILGVGIAYSLLPGTGDAAVNWHKASEVGLSLLCSPLFGSILAILLMALLARIFLSNHQLFKAPKGDTPPPWWIRGVLIATCGLVSFSHGSNDGQKGIGLMMLVLIGIIPAKFALDERYGDQEIAQSLVQVQQTFEAASSKLTDAKSQGILQAASVPLAALNGLTSEMDDTIREGNHRFEIRKNILLLRNEVSKLKEDSQNGIYSAEQVESVQALVSDATSLRRFTDYAPFWVIVLIALSLGIGTMIGWERIVVTIGEKIGKTHLTYAQGASAEIVAASTIAASTYLGLPVSTTHVLSSGIAGAMVSSGGLSNLDKAVIQKIVLAWVLTFPVCVTLSGTLFLVFRSVFS